MSRTSWIAAALVAAALSLPDSSLAIRRDGAWRIWWSARNAPARWQPSDTTSLGRLTWQRASGGVEWTELVFAGSGEAWRTRVIVARLDSRVVKLQLDTAFARDGTPAWSVERARARSTFAVNAGQFLHTMPWGRVVLGGSQWLAAGTGPLSSIVLIDSTGTPHISHATEAPQAAATWAFQSYPTLLRSGEVPAELRGGANTIDLEHRDARAAIGIDATGRVIVALTRFDALGSTLGFIPFGLTTPEMAAVMGALGARDAVMLDGGISGQMMIRAADGTRHTWRGTRAVPLALIAEPRQPIAVSR
jgi:hypothetical protein